MHSDHTAGVPARTTILLAAGVLAGLLLAPGARAADDHAHQGHDEHAAHTGTSASAGHEGHDAHAGHQMDTTRDAEGRRLWGQKHQMADKDYEELRAKVPGFRNAPKAGIDAAMVAMGPEYQWYISPDSLRNDAGVLVLTHGFREHGDRAFKQQLSNLASALPTSLSLGMAMMMSDHVQLSINDLEAAGAKRIVVVPIVSTRYNELMRQWEYIFGRRDEAEFVTVPQVTHKAEIVMAAPPEDHPLVGAMLVDHALEISENPAKESVIIVAHGASGRDRDKDNVRELEILRNLAKYVKEDGGFAEVNYLTLQDDAEPEVRDANVARLRGFVENPAKQGRATLVVTNLIGTRTIQPKIRQDLQGLDYKFNTKGLSQHPQFIDWIQDTVQVALERGDQLKKTAAAR